jgi:ABC-type uncharacterized transport system auxiliary subunit
MKANKPAIPRSRASWPALPAALGLRRDPKREPTAIFEPPRPAAPQPRLAAGELVAAGGQAGRQRAARQRPHRGAPGQGEITVYKASAWTDTAPDLVQSALLRRFEDSGKILSVARPGAACAASTSCRPTCAASNRVRSARAPGSARGDLRQAGEDRRRRVVARARFRETEPALAKTWRVADAFGARWAAPPTRSSAGPWPPRARN